MAEKEEKKQSQVSLRGVLTYYTDCDVYNTIWAILEYLDSKIRSDVISQGENDHFMVI